MQRVASCCICHRITSSKLAPASAQVCVCVYVHVLPPQAQAANDIAAYNAGDPAAVNGAYLAFWLCACQECACSLLTHVARAVQVSRQRPSRPLSLHQCQQAAARMSRRTQCWTTCFATCARVTCAPSSSSARPPTTQRSRMCACWCV
jgi:hypothetical protein